MSEACAGEVSPVDDVRVIVFEDHGWQRLLPLTYARGTFELICGTGSLLRRALRATEVEVPTGRGAELWCRPLLADVVAERVGLPANRGDAEEALLLNGRGWWRRLPHLAPGDGAWVGLGGPRGDIACVKADAALSATLNPAVMLDEARLRAALAGLPRRDVSADVTLMDWPWELVLRNKEALLADWEQGWAPCQGIETDIPPGSHVLAAESVTIGAGTRIKPCVVIDAEDGPVWIGRGVTILPHTYIQGPALIGDDCLIQPGAVVHAGTTIGPRSKVGGEIEASIIQGYSNKQHDGFLGHSYLGAWVNVAADCINSDLKNTYGTVRVPINGHEVETGEMFVGLLVGDHSKAGINVSFPTGAVIGFCSSVFAPQSPKFVPSFAWVEGRSVKRYDEHRGIALARRVMARRQHQMSPAEERLFLAVRRQALAIELQPQIELEAF